MAVSFESQQKKYATYPNEAVPDEVKESPEYALSVAKYIEGQWFGYDNRYQTRLSEFRTLRRHMKGKIDITEFYDLLGLDEDRSKNSVDWTPVRFITKFINDVTYGLTTRINKIKVTGVDPISNGRRAAYSEFLEKFMLTGNFIKEFDEAVDTSLMPESYIPEDDDELELHMRFDYHTATESVSEDSITKVMELNSWEILEKELTEDFALLGEGGMRVKRNGGRIRYERVEPENAIYSYDTLNSSDRRGTFYHGWVRNMTIGELKSYASSRGEELSNDYIEMIVNGTRDYIARTSQGGRDRNNYDYDDDQATVQVIDFCYKTSKHITRKVKKNGYGGIVLTPKESTFQKDPKGRFDVLQSSYDTWYEGLFPLSGDRVIGYQEVTNLPRKRSNLKETIPPIIYFTTRGESIGRRILPYTKQLYINFLKIQQLIAKMRPDGIAVDISALTNIEIMDGKKLTAADIIKTFDTTGNLIYDGENLEGEYDSRREPIRDNPSPVTNKLQQLIQAYLHNIQQIRDETGIAATATPDPKSLIGVQKIALANAQVAARPIEEGVLNVTKRVAEATLMHLQMMARNNVFSKQLETAIGVYNADAMEDFAKIGDLEYDVIIELEPDEEQKANFQNDLTEAVKTGAITFEDKIEINKYKNNIKYATQLLKVKMKKRMKAVQQAEQSKAQIEEASKNADHQREISKAAQLAQIEVQKQQQIEGFKIKGQMDLEQFKMELMMQYGNPQSKEKFEMETHKNELRKDLENHRDKSKDTRLERQATITSEITEQRQKETGPKDFERRASLGAILE